MTFSEPNRTVSERDQGDQGHQGALREIKPLLEMLERQCANHRMLHGMIKRKQAAIRTADIDAITDLCEQEQALARRIGDVEKQRLVLVGGITEKLDPGASQPMTLREIAEQTEEPVRTRLIELAESLRAEIVAVGRDSSIVTAASQSLSRHMAGLMQTVQAALSRVGVYERRGRIAVGSQMDFSVDLKS